MRALPRVLTCGVAAASALLLAGCAGAGPAAERGTQVEVRIAASAHPVDYEVQLAQADGGFRTVHRMRTGQSRTFAVPAGWLTVRIPGLCVVPTPGAGPSVVEVDSRACRLA